MEFIIKEYPATGTGYYISTNAMEGGYDDRDGNLLFEIRADGTKVFYTLQSFLDGLTPYVAVAMDSKAFAYGTPLRIPELEAKYGKAINFVVVDTGGDFINTGTHRIDIYNNTEQESLDETINGPLTLVVVEQSA